MKIYSISQNDTNLIKGLAIFCIVFHNFFHWISPSPGENEFLFNEQYIYNFFSLIKEKPTETINVLFSYLGHYGVQIFVFISGLGLTYSMKKSKKSWSVFMSYRLKKLIPLLLTGVIVFFLSSIIINQSLITKLGWHEILYKMLFIHTMLPYSGLSEVGPWWFFGLIIQLYLLFPFLYKLFEKFDWKTFLTFCIISYGWIFFSHYYFQDIKEVSVMQNAPGHLPEFCFGIWFAQNKDKKIHLFWLLISIVIFVLGNFFHVFYPFTFIAVTIIFIFAYPYIKRIIFWKQSYLQSFFLFLGNLSMIIFAVHAIFRYPFVYTLSPYQNAGITLCAGVLFFITIIGVSIASKKIYDFLLSLFNKIKIKQPNKCIERTIISLVLAFFCYVIFYYIAVNCANMRQNMIPLYCYKNDTITVEKNYINLAKYQINDNPYKIYADIEFDYFNETDNKPAVILSITGIVWQRYYMIEGIKNKDDSDHYIINYKYLRPFVQFTKNKEISIYLWNNNNSIGEIKNVSISVYKE